MKTRTTTILLQCVLKNIVIEDVFTFNDADVLATLLNALFTLLERRDGATLGEEVGRVEGIGIVDAFVEFIFQCNKSLNSFEQRKKSF